MSEPTIQERLRDIMPGDMAKCDGATIDEAANRIDALEAENARLREQCRISTLAFEDIAKGAGPYSRDPLTHADNCVESMKHSANYALGKTADMPEWAVADKDEQAAREAMGGDDG